MATNLTSKDHVRLLLVFLIKKYEIMSKTSGMNANECGRKTHAVINEWKSITWIICACMSVRHCRPIFNASSDNQTEAKWLPGGITETEATEGCRAIIVNRTVIGQSCVDSLSNQTSSADIVQACINDVQVMPIRKYYVVMVWVQRTHVSIVSCIFFWSCRRILSLYTFLRSLSLLPNGAPPHLGDADLP